MTFVDTGILVGALLSNHAQHDVCLSALEESDKPFTNAHALAEAFSTLTSHFQVPPDAAAEMTLSVSQTIPVEALALADYETAISEARRRGVMGGGIYDSLHATYARRKGAKQIVTRNPSHFVHVAPDMEILTP
jgi:predicted nucleic acid-binding protein